MEILIIIAIIAMVAYIFLKKDNGNSSAERSHGARQNAATAPQKAPPARDWEATWQPSAPLKASGKCGANVNWALYEDGQLIITGSGQMYDYYPTTMEDGKKVTPWYQYRMMIKSAKVGKGITYLGDWVLAYCKNLEDVTLSCTTETMPWGGFFECEKLQQIVVPNGVKRIRSECFLDCPSLRVVRLPNGVNEIGDSAFSGCSSLVSINLPESLTDIDGYAFAHCPNLRQIRIPRGTSYIHKNAFYNSGVNVPPRGYGAM